MTSLSNHVDISFQLESALTILEIILLISEVQYDSVRVLFVGIRVKIRDCSYRIFAKFSMEIDCYTKKSCNSAI